MNYSTERDFGKDLQKYNEVSPKPSHASPRLAMIHHDSPFHASPRLAMILLTPIRCSCRNGTHINPKK